MSMYAMLPYKRTNGQDLMTTWERAFLSPFYGKGAFAFSTDIIDMSDHYLLEADLPGFDKKDIDIHIDGDQLIIKASYEAESEDQGKTYVRRERRNDTFMRSFSMDGIDVEKISAAYDNGVLKLTLPKMAEVKPESKKIVVH